MDFKLNIDLANPDFEYLEKQEKELYRLLGLIKKAKEMFGRETTADALNENLLKKKDEVNKKDVIKVDKVASKKTNLEKIMEIVNDSPEPLKSSEIMLKMYNESDKKIPYHIFKQNLFPVFTRAYKKDLKRVNGYVRLNTENVA